jgi:hypothetical protein
VRTVLPVQPKLYEHKNFGSPFDESDSDLVLRSSDNVDFMVHKTILRIASPFFRTMFSLPQNADATSDDTELVDGLICIHMSEDSGTLSRLLSFIYPSSLLLPTTFTETAFLLSAFQKFELDTRLPLLKRALKDEPSCSVTGANAFETFFLSYRLGLKEETVTSAILTLQNELKLSALPEIEDGANGSVLLVLHRHRLDCKRAVLAYLSKIRDGLELPTTPNNRMHYQRLKIFRIDGPSESLNSMPSWWISYFSNGIADLTKAAPSSLKIAGILSKEKFKNAFTTRNYRVIRTGRQAIDDSTAAGFVWDSIRKGITRIIDHVAIPSI